MDLQFGSLDPVLNQFFQPKKILGFKQSKDRIDCQIEQNLTVFIHYSLQFFCHRNQATGTPREVFKKGLTRQTALFLRYIPLR